MDSTIPSIEEFRKLLLQIRKRVLELYSQSDLKVIRKSDKTPVTEVDLYIENELTSFLEQTGFPIISEEQKNKKIKHDSVWYVDPLDGTRDFIDHTDEFSIMIGLVENTKPIFGIVYQPVNDKLFFAWKGKGAYLQVGDNARKELHLKENNDLAKVKAIVSRNHFLESDQEMLDICGITKKIHCGSIGVKIGSILEGKADIFCNTSNKTFLWDTCAPQIILEEAGGKFATLQGKEIVYKTNSLRNKTGIIASNALLYEDILVKISK